MTRGTGNEGNVGAPRPEPAAGGSASCTSALRARPVEGGSGARGIWGIRISAKKTSGGSPTKRLSGRGRRNVGAPRPEPAAGGKCLLHLRFARPPRGGRGGRAGDMGVPHICEKNVGRAGDMGDPHICEKNVGRKPDEAAFWKGSARGNLFLLKEVPPRRSLSPCFTKKCVSFIIE